MTTPSIKAIFFSLSALLFMVSFSGILIANPIDDLKKVGEAKLKVLFWDIFNSSLYSENGEYQVDQFPQALKINYLRDVDSEDLIVRTQNEWEKLGIKKEIFSPWITLLSNIYPDIIKGDTLSFIVKEDQQSDFYLNGKKIGIISDQTFGKNFLRIWLDENCSYPNLRKKLIGLK